MKASKRNITFKVLIGYIILGVLASISTYLMFHEIKTLTELQRQDFSDRNTIVKVGSLIADIYENESLARAAVQFNSAAKFNDYITGNDVLLQKSDSLSVLVGEASQKKVLDSIKLFITKKRQNIIDLINLKNRDKSSESIDKVINKLTSIDSVLGKVTINDLVKNPENLSKEKRKKFEEYVRILNKYNPRDSINKIGQKQIDSLLSISKTMLKEAQRKTSNRQLSLQKKEQELIENDLTIFRKLQELLGDLERDIIFHVNTVNQQKEQTLNHSKNIILFAAGTSFIIIIIFSIIILNDFWKTQRYRKQLEEANITTSSLLKSREQLISMVSHDLRTPLNTISGFSELLQKNTKDNKEKNYVDHIKNASEYMGQLVDDLLEFSKLENEKVNITHIAFNLKKLIDDIALNAQQFIENKVVNIIVNHDKTIVSPVISDPFRLKQILYNLVVNACKFTNKGTITIKSVLKDNILYIFVSDTGIGIGSDQKEHIFKAFAQAKNNTDQKQHGFGLGLTISKKLTELLGGTLTLKSELNKGSIFTLQIPVTTTKKTLYEDKEQSPTTFNLNAIVVEDDLAMQQLLKNLLKQYGIKVFLFGNAKKALKQIDTLTYDFVLTDIQLPKMNGIHFMETLKNHVTYKNQPVIAMTGREKMSVKDYINSGFSEVLIKPFKSNELQEILQRLFYKHYRIDKNIPQPRDVEIQAEGFNIKSLAVFLNNDKAEIKKSLCIFLNDTKSNYRILKEAKHSNDVSTINSIGHKMMSMFKQLEVVKIIPFLETFETSKTINGNLFKIFEKELDKFIKALEKFIDKF
ncbi:MAG: ATP-binding protein [Aestuariibaculum sp.]